MLRLALAVLGAAVLAGGGLAASAANEAEPSRADLAAQIRRVMDDEERVWRLLAKEPPRYETAKLVLTRARTALRAIETRVPAAAGEHLIDAWRSDGNVLLWIEERRVAEGTFLGLTHAHRYKASAQSALLDPRPGAPQCSDGRDNDGDGLADNAFDSGCSSGKDATERSPLACTLGIGAGGAEGTCSGPFARLQIVLPRDGFDTTKPPTASFAGGCRYASERKLECIFRDGQVNPGHRLRVRFKLDGGTIRVGDIRVFDFRGRRFDVRPRAAAPAPPPAFQLAAYATYAHGSSSSNVCVFVWTVPGQPPLRGGVTLTGPIGEQTNPFTTLGGDRKTRVIFSVPQRGRYVADVTLAGKTAQAAASLGLAPTNSGEYACPSP